MDDIYKNIEEYNPNKKRELLIVSDDIIADMLSNKKLNPIVAELFIRDRKLNISLALIDFPFIICLILLCQKNIQLNSTQYFVMRLPNKRELQKIAFNHSPAIDFHDLVNLYEKRTANPFSILVINPTCASNKTLRSRKNHVERI